MNDVTGHYQDVTEKQDVLVLGVNVTYLESTLKISNVTKNSMSV